MAATAASILTRGGGALIFSSSCTLRTFPTYTTSSSSLVLNNFHLSVFRNCVGKSTRRLFCAGPQSEPAVVVMEDESSSVPPNPEEVAREGADLLDIRVGRIVRAWRHPEADSLYVEEVDVGEPEPRTICSGLVKYIPLDHLEGKNIVVLANLKPRNMRGVKSNGMIMAASDAPHENVELLEPPEGSTPGERIWFGSDEEKSRQPDAATPNQVQKKKIWESVQPHLKTTESCEAVLLGVHLMRTSAGIVTCKSLRGGNIS